MNMTIASPLYFSLVELLSQVELGEGGLMSQWICLLINVEKISLNFFDTVENYLSPRSVVTKLRPFYLVIYMYSTIGSV